MTLNLCEPEHKKHLKVKFSIEILLLHDYVWHDFMGSEHRVTLCLS